MQSNFNLKAHLHSLIPSFTIWVTQSVKKGMYHYFEILNTFLAGNLFWSYIVLFKRYSVPSKGNIYLKVQLYRLIPPFSETVTQSIKRGMCLVLRFEILFFVRKNFILHNNILKFLSVKKINFYVKTHLQVVI